MELICQECGNKMEAVKSTKKYCSDRCTYDARNRRYRENKSIMSEKVCLICESKFKPHTPAANLRQCCYNCMPDGVQLTRSMFIVELKKKFGSKCQKCGYDTYSGALDFHHLDPSQKDFTISNMNFKLKDAIEEIKKCILLCSNCHKEFHAGLWTLEELKGGLADGINN